MLVHWIGGTLDGASGTPPPQIGSDFGWKTNMKESAVGQHDLTYVTINMEFC